MAARVSPTERIRADIDALFTGGRDLTEVLEDVARLGARLIIQIAVEAEVGEFLGRTRYQRAAGSRAAGVAMAFKLTEAAQAKWRAVNAPHLVALVRVGARFERGILVERPDELGGDQQVA